MRVGQRYIHKVPPAYEIQILSQNGDIFECKVIRDADYTNAVGLVDEWTRGTIEKWFTLNETDNVINILSRYEM